MTMSIGRAPALTARQKRGAFLAGFLALNLIDLGGSLLLFALLFGVLLAFVTSAVRLSSTGEPGSPLGPEPREFLSQLQSFNAPLWLGAAAVLGALLIVAGILLSRGVLARHGVARPWAVTWSAIGISIPVLFVLASVTSIAGQIVGTIGFAAAFRPSSSVGSEALGVNMALGIALAIVGILVSVAVIGVAGWLLWWWMAHVLRSPRPAPRP